MVNWPRLQSLGEKQLGKPYIFGAVADITCDDPVAFDCAELVYWLYGKVGIKVPNYSDGQFKASLPTLDPKLGDIGFFKRKTEPCHHVGLWFSPTQVLEARGEPYNKVIFRPVHKWEAWKEFTGWRRLIAVSSKERGYAKT
jgi:cell wall-associated NlpC family hydrolase